MKVAAMNIYAKAARALSLACMGVALVAVGASPAAAQHGVNKASIDTGGVSEVSKSIVLPLDKAAIVELPYPAADVLVSQPSVVDAVIRSPRRVYLMGLQTGQTNAFFFDSRGRQILNLEIMVERDMDALSELIERVMPNTRIEVESINDNVVLRGTVQNAGEAANAALLAGRFVDDEEKVVSLISIREPEQVMLKVRIVEMQRQLMRQLGVSHSGILQLNTLALGFATGGFTTGGIVGDVANATIPVSGLRNPIGDITELDSQIEALETHGLVRVLAEPNLTALSGESARFLAGGEFPIPVGQEDGVISIEFKEFGVGLGFSPVVLSKGRINLEVSTEVSEVTTDNAFFLPGATTVDENGNLVTTTGLAIPGLSVRRANTTVELPSGGSLVLAGLLQEDMRQTIEGIPGVKDVPVLGALFRSRDYQNSETELVIIVTPYLVEPTHESKLIGPEKGFAPASEVESLVMGRIMARYGLAGAGVREASLQGPMGFILD
ncbi:MAG: type II and III secretion system protein family protein [Pseudomonadota bacterium]